MIKTLLLPFQTIVVKVAVTTDNKLHILANGQLEAYDLKAYNFDINKPIAQQTNHLFDKTLIRQIKQFIKAKTSKYGLIFPQIIFHIAVCNLPDKNSIDHFLDFAEILHPSKIELMKLTMRLDEFLHTENIDKSNIVASLNNRNIRNIKTEYLDN